LKITDIGIILSSKKLQEKLLLIKIFSKENGICAGVARSPSPKKIADYQVGNIVKFQRFSRLSDQLGTLTCECTKSYQFHIMNSKLKLHAFNSMSALILSSFIEYEPHIVSYSAAEKFLSHLEEKEFSWLKFCLFELELLNDAGYGLELEACAVTGKSADLAYVSPKSGRAVSKEGAKGYEHLLLKLPSFILNEVEPKDSAEIEQALDLSEYFFERYIWKQRNNADVLNVRAVLRSIISI